MKMKARDIRQLSVKELQEKVSGLEEELFNLRFQAKMGQLSNALRLRIVRKDIARVKTLINEKRGDKIAAAPKVEVRPIEEAKPVEKTKPKEKSKETAKEKAKPKEKTKRKVKASSK
jgi:large subunit ribosomal protein L29